MKRVAVWLDDLRDPHKPPYAELLRVYTPGAEIVWAKDVSSFKISVLKILGDPACELAGLFFDNDLGGMEPGSEGRHAFTWFEQLVHLRKLGPVELFAQTANPAAKRELTSGFAALRRFWEKQV